MNKWIGIGRLTRDPEVRTYYKSENESSVVAKYTLAINRRGGAAAGTDYIPCTAFGRNGEFAEKYLRQGIKVAVTGHIQTGSYTNKDGDKVYTTEVIIEEQEFAESKKAAEETNTEVEQAPESKDGFMNIPEGIENDLPFK